MILHQNCSLLHQESCATTAIFEIKHTPSTCHVAFSTCTGSVSLLDVDAGRVISRIQCHDPHSRMGNFQIDQISGNLIYTCSSEGTVRAFDVRCCNQQAISTLSVGARSMNYLDLCPTQPLLLTASDEGWIDLFDLRCQRPILSCEELHTQDAVQVQFTGSASFLTGSIDGLVTLCHLDTFIQEGAEMVLNIGSPVSSFVQRDNFLAVATTDEQLSVWDFLTATQMINYGSVKREPGVDFVVGVHGAHLFTGAFDGSFEEREMGTDCNCGLGVVVNRFEGASDVVRSVCLVGSANGSGSVVLSGGDDGCIFGWKSSLGNKLA